MTSLVCAASVIVVILWSSEAFAQAQPHNFKARNNAIIPELHDVINSWDTNVAAAGLLPPGPERPK